MTAEDKRKPVTMTLKVHPKVVDAAKELAAWLDDSSLDHVVSEAVLDALKDKEFLRWKESRQAQAEPSKVETIPENKSAKPGKAVA